MYLKALIILVFAMGFTSAGFCSASSSSKKEFILGSAPKDVSADKIQDDLTRNDYFGVGPMGLAGQIRAKVNFVSEPLIEAIENEAGKKNMDGTDEIKKNVEKKKEIFSKGKSCFYAELEVVDLDIDAAEFKNWKVKLEQPKEQFTTLELTNVEGVSSVPNPSNKFGKPTWNSKTFACASKQLDLAQPFKVYLIPQFRGLDKKIALEWK